MQTSPQTEEKPRRRYLGGKKRGVKAGTVHSGSLKTGYDPRRHVPKPQTPQFKEIQARAADMGAELIETLYDFAKDPTVPIKERRACINDLLDRGYGTPVSMQLTAQIHGYIDGDTGKNSGELAALARDPSRLAALSDNDLLAIINAPTQANRLNQAVYTDGDIEDAELVED